MKKDIMVMTPFGPVFFELPNQMDVAFTFSSNSDGIWVSWKKIKMSGSSTGRASDFDSEGCSFDPSPDSQTIEVE